MRISDWSSDVCASDLHLPGLSERLARTAQQGPVQGTRRASDRGDELPPGEREDRARRRGCFFLQRGGDGGEPALQVAAVVGVPEIGSASCRERVCQYV